MRVRVLFFGQLKDIAGVSQEDAEISEGARVEDLYERYARRFPRLNEFRSSVAASVNQEYTEWRASLAPGDEVAFLPPVSGGQQAAVNSDIILLVREPIQPPEILRHLKAFEDGAAVIFDGFVRNNFKGQRTLYLEYEAYEPMAYAKLREIAAHIHAQFSIHRAAAFDACRYAIDTLKRTVPIWKKEFFAGGAVWAEGEPFPQPANSASEESTS